MSFLNFIKDNFNRVLSVDTEFRMDETKTIPKKVVCFCYEDVFTGETWEFWEHDKPTNFEGHFDNDKNLIVCLRKRMITFWIMIYNWRRKN